MGADGTHPSELWAEHEWHEEDGTWRQAMIPAAKLNGRPMRVLSDDEIDALTVARFERFRSAALAPR